MKQKTNNPTRNIVRILAMFAVFAATASCSSTRNIPEDDQLYIGLKKIEYNNYERNDHFYSTQEEVEAALATAPNGALFGSSYYRTPPYRLWIWNAFTKSESHLGQWIAKNFGKAPVLMSWVNPSLRAQVARELLVARGYFGADVSYKVIEQSNPRKAKIGYTVNLGHLSTIDSLCYRNFPDDAQQLIDSTQAQALIHNGDPFDVSQLDAERTRLSTLLRNNGYFYYQPSYASYLADTTSVPGRALVHLQYADSLPAQVGRKWHIGHIDLQLRRNYMQQMTDSIRRRRFTVHYSGKRSPMRTRVIMRDLKLRPGQLYSYDLHQQSVNKLTGMGLFSRVDISFTPRDTSALCDTLDMTLNCIFDKPYDFYVETSLVGKTTGRLGPGITIGFAKRNAFRGGEKLSVNLKGSYEWQTGHQADGTSSKFNSYEYGADATLELPRLLLPMWRRKRWYETPSTVIKFSSDIIKRSGFFKRHIVSGELTYIRRNQQLLRDNERRRREPILAFQPQGYAEAVPGFLRNRTFAATADVRSLCANHSDREHTDCDKRGLCQYGAATAAADKPIADTAGACTAQYSTVHSVGIIPYPVDESKGEHCCFAIRPSDS